MGRSECGGSLNLKGLRRTLVLWVVEPLVLRLPGISSQPRGLTTPVNQARKEVNSGFIHWNSERGSSRHNLGY